MGIFDGIVGVIMGGLAVSSLYFLLKNQPNLFSKENLNRSFFTMGVLALGLITLITIVVIALRA
jgi:hypothetical protein